MKRLSCHDLRQHFFTFFTLLGCVTPFVTPRLFPVHEVPGAREPVVMPWVGEVQVTSTSLVNRQTVGRVLGRSSSNDSKNFKSTRRIVEEGQMDLSRAQCIIRIARS